MAGLLLKIAKSSYEAKLAAVEGAIGELENVRGEYNSLIGQLDSDVIERSSSEFQAVEDAVKENLQLIETSIRNAENAREALSASAPDSRRDSHSRFSSRTTRCSIPMSFSARP